MRSRYKIVEQHGIHFVTFTIIEWLPVFTGQKYFDIIIQSLKFCRQNKELKLYAFVILENHLHLIVAAKELAKVLGAIKRHTARKIVDALKEDNKKWLLTELAFYKKKYKKKSDYQVWQEGVHPKLMSTGEIFNQKLEYVHFNPVKRGYVDYPEHWRYSSARNCINDDRSIIEIDGIV